MIRIFRPVALCLALILASCTQFPELDSQLSDNAKNADYPTLLPVEHLLAGVDQSQISPEMQAGLTARIANLKARAARLRGRVIDSGTRQRMAQGVQR